MRYFLTGRHPQPKAILLVESGSREIVERLITGLRGFYGDGIPIDLMTCYASLPRGFEPHNTRVYRVLDYRGRARRRELYRELAGNGYAQVGIICSNEPVMLKWKWAIALRLPAKVFVVNENADYFWLDRLHLGAIRDFILTRTGLAGAGAVRTLVRVLSFPFTLAYLILYAAAVHARRAFRGVNA